MARFKRLDGFDVRYLTGTDEHGQKMQQTAIDQGITPMELATRNADVFKKMDDDVLNISYDRFIRTTDADHHASSQEIWRRMEANGDIYLEDRKSIRLNSSHVSISVDVFCMLKRTILINK